MSVTVERFLSAGPGPRSAPLTEKESATRSSRAAAPRRQARLDSFLEKQYCATIREFLWRNPPTWAPAPSPSPLYHDVDTVVNGTEGEWSDATDVGSSQATRPRISKQTVSPNISILISLGRRSEVPFTTRKSV
ncbi:hypothetical protein J6590_000920 [Homalodisca vitripennis]|nr:hypothetical protein J6590_000920 [Homalodisca vitripennis]